MASVTPSQPAPARLKITSQRRNRNNAARGVFVAAALTTFLITVLIIGTLAFDAWDFVRQITAAERGQGWQLALTFATGFAAAALAARFAGERLATVDVSPWVRRAVWPVTFAAVIAVGFTVFGGWRLLNSLATELTQIGWFPRRGLFDMSTIIVGTLVIAVIAMVVAVPLGVGAAVYLAEYARPKVRKVIKPIIEVLAGIPSVVLAFFALAFINPNIVVRFFDPPNRAASMLAAGIAVGILTIPIIASVTEDALRAVPLALREASFGLGAERSQTTFRVVFPAAISGIVAALILGLSRAIGETMVVAIAAGASGGALFTIDPRSPGQTMTAAMASLGFGSDQVAGNAAAFQSLFFIGALLFLMTLLLNVLGDKLVARVREVY